MDPSTITTAGLDKALTIALRLCDERTFDQLATEADRRDAEREARLNAPEALANAALWYAKQGLKIFPLRPLDKSPYPGSRGFKDASNDLTVVREWWTHRPSSNIGFATGDLLDVIDVDGAKGYASMRDNGFSYEALGISYTPGDSTKGKEPGKHIFVAPTGDNNAADIWPGVDYRGKGGYVVLPPSRRPDGRYRWSGSNPLNLTGVTT